MLTRIHRLVLLMLAFGFCSFLPEHNCGTYRWDYKILVDDTGWPLLNKHAVTRTIAALEQLPRPAALGNQRTPLETTKVTVTAWVTMLGKEADGDYHLVLANNAETSHMIAEIPDPTCSKVTGFPALVEKYTKARQFVDDQIGVPTSQVTPLDQRVKVKITGFLFFDKVAHGNGHAENGIEIHPVIAISAL